MDKNKSVTTKNEQETIKFAKNFLENVLKDGSTGSPRGASGGKSFRHGSGRALIFYLTGELGAGKTHFVKGLAQALGIEDNITSPTFVLMKKFVIGEKLFFHIDCYRIYDSKDAEQIGLDKVFKNPRAIIAIEWAERIEDIIPMPYWEVRMEHVGDTLRRIVVKNVQR